MIKFVDGNGLNEIEEGSVVLMKGYDCFYIRCKGICNMLSTVWRFEKINACSIIKIRRYLAKSARDTLYVDKRDLNNYEKTRIMLIEWKY